MCFFLIFILLSVHNIIVYYGLFGSLRVLAVLLSRWLAAFDFFLEELVQLFLIKLDEYLWA